MKRFLQKSYSWLTMVLLTIMFAVSGNVAAATVTLPLNNGGGTVDGVSYVYTSCDWAGTANIYGENDINAGWGTIQLRCFDAKIVKVEFDCYNNSWSSAGLSSIAYAVVENYAKSGSFSVSGHKATWEGSANELNFSASDDVDVREIVVYTEAGGGGEGGGEAKAVELPFNTGYGNVDGVGFTYTTANWVNSAELYGSGDANATWGTIRLNNPAANIVKVELTCALNSWSGVGSTAAAAATVVETEALSGTMSTNGAVAVWEGSAHNVTFSSTDDIDVVKIVVYVEQGGGVVKECTVEVKEFASNVKPGKLESLSKWITIYMMEPAAVALYTGSDNCPEGVTLTNEAGESIRVAQFNTWQDSDQIGVQLDNQIDEPGVYTLHIPEGLVYFQNGKWNKEINATWTIVAPDNRPTKEIAFDYANEGIAAEKEGVKFSTTGTYNATGKYLRGRNEDTMTFTAPEGCTIKSITLLQEGEYTGSPAGYTANVGEVNSYDNLTLNWAGDDATVVLTHGGATCYFTKAIVVIAGDNLGGNPDVDLDAEAYPAWKELLKFGGLIDNVAYEYGYQAPTADVPGKKPAAVVAPIVEAYNNFFGLANYADYATAANILASYGTTIHENYEYLLGLIAAYEAAELVPEVVEPTYTEPVLSAADVSNEVAYYIFTDARGGLTVDGTQLKGTKEVGKSVDPTDVSQQFAFVNWEGNLYLYSLSAEKFIGKANRGNFTDEPVDPIYFKNAYNGTVMLYFDNSFNFNLGGSNQVTIDNWTTKDAGNSFKIMVAEKFDQTALLEKLANGGGEVVDPVDPVDLSKYAGNYLFDGGTPSTLTGERYYDCEISVSGNQLLLTGWLSDTYTFTGTYDAASQTITFGDGDLGDGFYDSNYNYYYVYDFTLNVNEDENGNITLTYPNEYRFFMYDWDNYNYVTCSFSQLLFTKDGVITPDEPAEWNGNIILPETASSLDDLLSYTVEFEYADDVHAAAADVLGVIFDGENPYAIALANGVFNVFGDVEFNDSKATVTFVKISDLNADLQASAKAAAARIGGFTPTAGTATVAFASHSFVVDGQLVDLICKSYDIAGGSVTGINGIYANGTDSIYDLSGRRVNNVGSGLYIRNGVKVYRK